MYPNSKKISKKKQKMKYDAPQARRVTVDGDDANGGVVVDKFKRVTDYNLNMSSKKMVHDTNDPKTRHSLPTVDALKFEVGLNIPDDTMSDGTSSLMDDFTPPSPILVPPPKVNDVPGGYTFGDVDTSLSTSSIDIWDALPFAFSSEEEEMLQNEPISQLPSDDFMRLISMLESVD